MILSEDREYSSSSSVYRGSTPKGGGSLKNDFLPPLERLSNKSYSYQQATPPTPHHTGERLITKRFFLLCKEGLGEVVIKRLTC